ncbi:immune inhibitor A domain-containing protein [Candidatus Hodarchaeum mangrovi]
MPKRFCFTIYTFFGFLILISLLTYHYSSINGDNTKVNINLKFNISQTTLNVLVVLMEIPDDPYNPMHTPLHYEDLFFSTGTDSIRQYYQNVSYNEVSLTGEVLGWFPTLNNRSYYGAGERTPPGQDFRADEIAYEARGHAISSGKNPQNYDLFVVIHSGDGQEYSGDSEDIWSHQWSLWRFELPEVVYSMNHEYVDYETPSHELGHALDFPDLYDLSYTHDFAGPYCIMDGGPGHFSIWNKYYSHISKASSPQFISSNHRLQINNYSKDTIVTINPIASNIPSGIMWLELGWNSSGFINTEHGRGWTVTVRENLDYDKYLPKHGLVIAEIQVGPRTSGQTQVSLDVSPPWNVIDSIPETSENKDDAAFSLGNGEVSSYSSGKGWAVQIIEKLTNLSYRVRVTNESNIPKVSLIHPLSSVSDNYSLLVYTDITSKASIESVEVSIDYGPWSECSAVLETPNLYTFTWQTDLEREGSHIIRARAFDNSTIPYIGYSDFKIYEVDNNNGSILVIDDDLGRNSEASVLSTLDLLGLTGDYEVFQTSSFINAEITAEELWKYNLILWVGNPAISPLSNSHINYNEFLVIKEYLTNSPSEKNPRIIFMSSYNIFDFSNQGDSIQQETSLIFRATSPKNFRAPSTRIHGLEFLSTLPTFTLGSNDTLRATRSSDGEVVNLLSGAVSILEDELPVFPGYKSKGYYVDNGKFRILNYLFQPEMVPEYILNDLLSLSINFMNSNINSTFSSTSLTSTSNTISKSNGFLDGLGLIDDPILILGTLVCAGGLSVFILFRLLKKRKTTSSRSYWLKKFDQ